MFFSGIIDGLCSLQYNTNTVINTIKHGQSWRGLIFHLHNLNSNQANPNHNKKVSKNKPKELTCCTWNIRRGLITREAELKNILQTNQIDIMFLTETDSIIKNENDYCIDGYNKRGCLDSTNLIEIHYLKTSIT